jgi:tetratricopeptide (TPR) repeat protein
MNFRDVATIAIGAIGMAALIAPGAHAAVTVLGNGVAQSCYETAEFGGNPRDGITTCDVALNQTALSISDRAATYVNRGILKSRNDDSNGALDDYDRGLKLNANLGEGYVDRGAVLIVLQRYDDALKDIDKGIGLGSKQLEIAYYDRAIVDEALGDIRGAYEDYKKAVELQPDFTLASEQLQRFKVVRKRTDGT